MGDAKAATAAAANGAGAPVEQVPLTELEELQLQVDNGVHEVSVTQYTRECDVIVKMHNYVFTCTTNCT